MINNLRIKNINPINCSYTLLAYGPIYPEQETKEAHDIHRDKVAALEAELAYKMKMSGYKVLGAHPKRKPIDVKKFEKLWDRFRNKLT